MNTTKCRARTKSGELCKARPTLDGFCSIHSNPERAAELGRRSGKCRRPPESEPVVLLPPKTAVDLHVALLGQIFSKVSSGEMDVRLGRSLGYIASVLVRQLNCQTMKFGSERWRRSFARSSLEGRTNEYPFSAT